MFRVPDGSSSSPQLPSTPDSRKQKNIFAASNPSTTPAAPPPSSINDVSTTPAGPPPSSVIGSTRFNSGGAVPSFQSQIPRKSPSRTINRGRVDSNQQYGVVHGEHEHDGDRMDFHQETSALDVRGQNAPQLERKVPSLDFHAVAKGLSRRVTQLDESDDFILRCENIVQKLDDFVHTGIDNETQLGRAFASAVWDIIFLLQQEESRVAEFGNEDTEQSSPIRKSLCLVSLVLSIHHPPYLDAHSRSFGNSRLAAQRQTIPAVLLSWLDTYQNPAPNDLREVLEHEENPCADDRFWDVIFSLGLRGKLHDVITLLKSADFQYAITALEDGAEEPGYQGSQLGNTKKVVSRAIQVLQDCPAVSGDNWNITDEQWRIFRKKVDRALEDLKIFASDQEQAQDDAPSWASQSRFGNQDFSMSLMSRRAQSNVPWTIYQNLQIVYKQLLGRTDDIVASCTDWIEATICSTVWWDGDTDINSNKRLHDRSQKPRQVDISPQTAYLERLKFSLENIVTKYNDTQLEVNTTDPLEVGTACIFTNDFEGLISILRGWSATTSTALVEIAFIGDWPGIQQLPNRDIMNNFDASDLMVLSYNQMPRKGVDRDDLLTQYASLLFQKGTMESKSASEKAEGWEVAISVLSRLNDEDRSTELISNMLDDLKLHTSERVEKVVSLCNRIRLQAEAQKISEKYADSLTETSNNYGDALWYYARAHKPERVKDVLNLLVSFCLVQSIAYPQAADLDKTLRAIILTPKDSLAQLNHVDPEAAQLLSTELSGYATLRKYYELRDQEVNPTGSQGPILRPLERKKEAASILITLITSAADSIHGGLFDESVYSIMPVDGLLVLLSEALVFFNQTPRILTTRQLTTLLRATEDLSTSAHSIQQTASELYASALANHHDGGSTGFSLVGSAMLAGSRQTSNLTDASSEGSGLLVSRNVSRGWDWRVGLPKGMSAEEVIRLIRLGMARELSAAWTAF